MGELKADISMSLDGFIAGPNDDVDPLHQWAYQLKSFREPHGDTGGEENVDSDVLGEAFGTMGSVLMGKRMFTLAEEPWGDEPPFHAPVFVLTHESREPLAKKGGTTFTFATEGIERALEQAREAAGDKDVYLAGGAETIQQYIKAGLVDELQVHVVPVLLGSGIRLFDNLGTEQITLERDRVVDSPSVTHLRYRLPK